MTRTEIAAPDYLENRGKSEHLFVENGKRFTDHVILKYIHTVSANKTIVTIQIDESMKGAITLREYLRLSLCAIGNLLHGWKQGPWPSSIIRGQSLAVNHWRSIKRYRRSDLNLPGLDDESSPHTNQLPKGSTFRALASGGVHQPVVGTCSSGRRDVFIPTPMSASCQ